MQSDTASAVVMHGPVTSPGGKIVQQKGAEMNYSLEELKKMMESNGGSLDLSGTGITSLPDNLTVGGWLDLRGTGISVYEEQKVRRLHGGDYVEGRYIYADGILTHIKTKHINGAYTYYVGKIKGNNVISDGENYAHCKSFADGVIDLEFKKAKNRGSEQYEELTKDSVVSKDEAITMYRIITGACRAGTESFLSTIKEFKDSYTIRELIEITRGQYGASTFEKFFDKGE